MNKPNFKPQPRKMLRKLMHLKDWLSEVIDLMEEKDSNKECLVCKLLELVAFTLNDISEFSYG